MNCAQTDAMLDALMDGTLPEADLEGLQTHCAQCAECAEKLRLTQGMRRMLSDLTPEMDVPLQAQAAWRKAVRAEADKRRHRNLTRWAGGIAAALVVAVGGMFALRQAPAKDAPMAAMEKSVAVIEADGEAFGESIDSAASLAMPMVERRMRVEDLDRTCAYMADLAREYEGSIEEQRFEADDAQCANLYIDLPAENAADFLAAAAHYDLDGGAEDLADVGGGDETVSILLTLEAK